VKAKRLVETLQYVQLRVYGALAALEQEDFEQAAHELEQAGAKLREARDALGAEAVA
jgi:cellobiose-specific phosphotransferase system component IIA